MSVALPTSRLATAASLWRRAPLWRFTVLCGALLLLLALLYPPRSAWTPAQSTAPPPLAVASYTPSLQSYAPSPRPAAPAPGAPTQVASTPPPPIAPLPASPQPPAAPAHVSLATPGNPAASAPGIDTALIGRTYQHELLMNGFNVPLPPGDWAILASFNIWVKQSLQNKGITYFLGRIEKGRLVGAMHVNALRSPADAPTGFDAFKVCTNPDNVYTNDEGVEAFDHQACWAIHSYFTPPWQQWGDKATSLEGVVRAAAGDLAAKGVTYPQDLVSVHFFRSEKWGLLNVSYLFSPAQDGIQSNLVPTFRDSDWFGPNVQRYPEKVTYINKLKQWGESFWPRFKTAFDAGR
jgi:hypothetical protein